MDLGFKTEKNNVGIRINIFETQRYQFSAKLDNLDFFSSNLPKMDLGSQIQKTNVQVRINIVKMPCVPIFKKNR